MIDVLGCKINCLQKGDGPPVLFLHGNPDSSQMWEPVATALSAEYRCIVPDLPGYGQSTAPADFDYTLEGLSTFTESLFTALDLKEPVHLVGHDFGGIAAAAWMTTHPERVRSFTACNTAFSAAYGWHYWARIWRTPLIGELSVLTLNRPVFRWELRRGSSRLSTAHIEATYEALTPSVKQTVLKLYRAVRQSSFVGWEDRYQAAAKKVPIQVLWGEGDPYIPDAFANSLGTERITKVPGAGHWLPVTEPDRVAQALRSFLGEFN